MEKQHLSKSGMRNYECLYIIGSQIPDAARAELIAKFQKMAGADATVDKWGIRKFATPIDYRREGFYVLMNFKAPAETVGKISALMNITEGIVRYMFISKTEKELKYDVARKTRAQRPESGEQKPDQTEFKPRETAKKTAPQTV